MILELIAGGQIGANFENALELDREAVVIYHRLNATELVRIPTNYYSYLS